MFARLRSLTRAILGRRQFEDDMSDEMRWYVGGQQKLMPELLAMVACTVNSYSRLIPGFWAPTSATWGSFQLAAQEQATAIYLFDEGITLREDLIVSYQTRSTTAWSRSVRILDQEDARVRARVGTPPN